MNSARALNAASAILVVLAFSYLLPIIFGDLVAIDHRYIWLAGELWENGENPYSSAYIETAALFFEEGFRPTWWVYPPSWWTIARATSAFDYESSVVLWRIFIVFCLVAANAVASATALRHLGVKALWAHGLYWAFTFSAVAVAMTVAIGQTSTMAYLGAALFVLAYFERSKVFMVVALVVLGLKPTTGVIFALFLLPSLFWWPALIGAAFVTGLLSAPSILTNGVMPVISGMASRLSEYGTDPANAPAEMTGARHLADLFFNADANSFLLVGIAAVIAIGVGLLFRSRLTMVERGCSMGLLLSSTAFFIPLHLYDLPVIFPIIFLAVPFGRMPAIILVLGMLVLWQSRKLEAALNLTSPETYYFGGSLLTSLVFLGLILLFLYCCARLKPTA